MTLQKLKSSVMKLYAMVVIIYVDYCTILYDTKSFPGTCNYFSGHMSIELLISMQMEINATCWIRMAPLLSYDYYYASRALVL